MAEQAQTTSIKPNSIDILLGRKANAFHHPGNQRYRHLIALNLRKYGELEGRTTKWIFVKQLLEEILKGGHVRFLTYDKKGKFWKEVSFRTCHEKIAHALRDGISKAAFGLDNGVVKENSPKGWGQLKPIKTNQEKTAKKASCGNESQQLYALQRFARLKGMEDVIQERAVLIALVKRQSLSQLESKLQYNGYVFYKH